MIVPPACCRLVRFESVLGFISARSLPRSCSWLTSLAARFIRVADARGHSNRIDRFTLIHLSSTVPLESRLPRAPPSVTGLSSALFLPFAAAAALHSSAAMEGYYQSPVVRWTYAHHACAAEQPSCVRALWHESDHSWLPLLLLVPVRVCACDRCIRRGSRCPPTVAPTIR